MKQEYAPVRAYSSETQVPLDDLLAITHEFIHPTMSRSALDRCLRWHGVSNLKNLIPQDDNI